MLAERASRLGNTFKRLSNGELTKLTSATSESTNSGHISHMPIVQGHPDSL